MKNVVRHNPLNDLSMDSPETIERSEEVTQDILHRLQLKHDQHDQAGPQSINPVNTHTDLQDVQDKQADGDVRGGTR